MNSISKHHRAKTVAPQPAESVHIFSSSRSTGQRNRMVEKAAYYAAERRGFEPGHELEDWLAAEQQIDELLMHTDPSEFMDESDSGAEERPW